MERNLYEQEHEDFRGMVRAFMEKEVAPHQEEWLAQKMVPKSLFEKAAEIGLMGLNVPEEYGGSGPVGYRYNQIISEETARVGGHLGGMRVHSDVCLAYILAYADDEQKQRWLPRIAEGKGMLSIAMTEPGTGSDLAGMKTTARLDGDHWVLNGAKTFITGGANADLVIVVARTSSSPDNRRKGLSLLVVEDGMPGFEKGRLLNKIGLPLQDTVELSFTDVHVPVANVLGEEGEAFSYLGNNLPQERLSIASGAVVACEAALRYTVDYVKDRQVFGQALASFQNTKFELAALEAKVEAARAMVDRAVLLHEDGKLTPVDAAKCKLFCTELQGEVVDRCLQLFGGFGYMLEYPIARLYTDARVSRIYGGTSEIMKTIIAKSMGI
ncbi:acyl-CoA dehydrogenase family protein [Cumulibacter manganitolerans]|uniref:acyl-CoA dehydrogenase family protein n=1 Tax=Cumulibacter manganitolerans TaxID=1884992 RepID=UPI001294AE07|nr:acyl-CoA dehydrogenase family protein [Cumulibacter manganitolerans]